jgi:hypothetical protein
VPTKPHSSMSQLTNILSILMHRRAWVSSLTSTNQLFPAAFTKPLNVLTDYLPAKYLQPNLDDVRARVPPMVRHLFPDCELRWWLMELIGTRRSRNRSRFRASLTVYTSTRIYSNRWELDVLMALGGILLDAITRIRFTQR